SLPRQVTETDQVGQFASAFEPMRFRGLLTVLFLGLLANRARAQQKEPATSPEATSLRLGLELVPPPFTVTLPGAPGVGLLWLRPRFTDWTREWANETRTLVAITRTAVFKPPAAPELQLPSYTAAIAAQLDSARRTGNGLGVV